MRRTLWEHTLSGRERKWTAMGRPLQVVSGSRLMWLPGECGSCQCASRFRSQARTSCLWPASNCRGTSSPSPLSIRRFLRWRPVCAKGIVSTVFSIAYSCSVLHARLHRGAVWCSRSAAGRWCEVLPVGRPRREHRAHVQVHIPQHAEHSSHLSTHRLRCSQHHCASLGRARTGAFCRFAGRPSPGLCAVPPALRFDALSIFA